jgi:serine O-acetyltransferase
VKLIETIQCDARRYRASPVQPESFLRLLLLCPGFQLGLSIRLQSALRRIPILGPLLSRIVWYLTTMIFGCDIAPHATFGPGIYFPHPTGIVIGGEWDIGAGVAILQGVTLGRIDLPKGRSIVGDDAVIGAGAKILGELFIGRDAKIGANAVVLSSVPEGRTAVGIPAKLLEKEATVVQQ